MIWRCSAQDARIRYRAHRSMLSSSWLVWLHHLHSSYQKAAQSSLTQRLPHDPDIGLQCTGSREHGPPPTEWRIPRFVCVLRGQVQENWSSWLILYDSYSQDEHLQKFQLGSGWCYSVLKSEHGLQLGHSKFFVLFLHSNDKMSCSTTHTLPISSSDSASNLNLVSPKYTRMNQKVKAILR
jgi:hypothetical protein